jgi:U2 small nuclear ribonucleoprotein A'
VTLLRTLHRLRHTHAQEREEALKVYGTLEQQAAAAADNTFEPGEGLPEQEAAAGNGAADADGGEDGGEGDGEGDEAAAAAAKPTAAPSAEQLTAIKAAVANAQTLEDAWRLEQALKAGDMPSELARKEEEAQQQQQQQQQQQPDGAAAMDEG